MKKPMNRLVIVGAGPVGLHAALQAHECGFDVTVVERGTIGAAVRCWEHVTLFTPFSMNSTAGGRKVVSDAGSIPADDALLTGGEYVDRYLVPLANCSSLAGRIQTDSELIAASRTDFGKSDAIGRPERAESPFRLLIRRASTVDEVIECDILLDCTGFVSRHRHVGVGGIPCPGELKCLTPSDYRIADSGTPGEHVVVIGSGYSAATSVCVLQESYERITWITRGDREQPIPGIVDDRLPERRSLTNRANTLATEPQSGVQWLPGVRVESMESSGGKYRLNVSSTDGRQETIRCDRVVANPGFRPDSRPFEELQIHRCYATEGTIKLAAHLLGDTAGDCLSQVTPGIELLQNPEPNFYILGAASYGRDSRFLLKNGLEQVEQLFDSISFPLEAAQ